MSNRRFEALRPFAKKFHRMEAMLKGMTDDELEVIMEEAEGVTSTNCKYPIYEAARWLKNHVRHEQIDRYNPKRR